MELKTEYTALIIYILVKSLQIDIHWSNPIKLGSRLNPNAHPLHLQTETLGQGCVYYHNTVWERDCMRCRNTGLKTYAYPLHNVWLITAVHQGGLLRGVQNAQLMSAFGIIPVLQIAGIQCQTNISIHHSPVSFSSISLPLNLLSCF